jgi:hypothetical protein
MGPAHKVGRDHMGKTQGPYKEGFSVDTSVRILGCGYVRRFLEIRIVNGERVVVWQWVNPQTPVK